MNWIRDNKLVAAVIAVAVVTVLWLFFVPRPASAADLGGNCCADLEERIAELEATTARKGNRKISLRVYGQVNKALLHVSGDGDSDEAVIENSNAETFVGFSGSARFAPEWSAGYVLEIGAGGFKLDHDYGPDNANELYTRRSFWFIDGPVGKVSMGLQSQATDSIAEINLANMDAAQRNLSLRPFVGPQIGDAADIFDGTRGNLVRYDTPNMQGFVASASWSNGDDDSDVWDAAARYMGEGGGFKFAAGVGYRRGLIIPTLATIGGDDLTVVSGSASVMHIQSGLFVNGAYGHATVDGGGSADAYHVSGGVETKLNTLGKTTVYGEFADSNDLNIRIYGGGIVQALDNAATDLYLTVRKYEVNVGGVSFEEARVSAGDLDATAVMAGARVRF